MDQEQLQRLIDEFETYKIYNCIDGKWVESTHPDDRGLNHGINRCIERLKEYQF